MRPDVGQIAWRDVVEGVPQLCSAVQTYCSQLRTALGVQQNDDVRVAMLLGMQENYASALWIFAGLHIVTQDAATIEAYRKIIDQPTDAQHIQLTWTDYIRKSVVTRVYFLLDHLLASLSQHLTGNSSRVVYQNAQAVQQTLGVGASDLDVISAMAYTRNAFHNNGVYKGQGRNYQIAGHAFEFIDGQQVQLAWPDIRVLIHNGIETALLWCQTMPDTPMVPHK